MAHGADRMHRSLQGERLSRRGPAGMAIVFVPQILAREATIMDLFPGDITNRPLTGNIWTRMQTTEGLLGIDPRPQSCRRANRRIPSTRHTPT